MALQHMWKSERVQVWVGSAQSKVSQRPGERDGGGEGDPCQDLNPSVSHSFLAHRCTIFLCQLTLEIQKYRNPNDNTEIIYIVG